MDPAKGGIAVASTRTTVQDYLTKVYFSFHGSDEGAGCAQAAGADLAHHPPPDFKVKPARRSPRKSRSNSNLFPCLLHWLRCQNRNRPRLYQTPMILKRWFGNLRLPGQQRNLRVETTAQFEARIKQSRPAGRTYAFVYGDPTLRGLGFSSLARGSPINDATLSAVICL